MNELENFVFSNEYHRDIDLLVASTGHQKCQGGYAYGPAVRSTYLFHYVHSGKGIYRTEHEEYHLGPGDLFLIFPGQRIYYEANQEDPWEYSWIGLKGMRVIEYISRTSLIEKPVLHRLQDTKISRLFEKLQRVPIAGNLDLLLNALAYKLLYELAETAPAKEKVKHVTPDDYIKGILAYIETNFDGPLSVNEISEHFALDRSYIHRLFKKNMRVSVKDYILFLRLNKACEYLASTELPISDISRSVGYEDTLYFSRLFKKKKGMSPTEYRLEKRKSAENDDQTE